MDGDVVEAANMPGTSYRSTHYDVPKYPKQEDYEWLEELGVPVGGRYFSAQVKTRIVIGEEVRLADGLKTPLDMLTARELEILQYIAWGKPKKEIADIVKLSINTINRHTSNLMAKLGIRDRVQLARFAIREGLIEA